MKIKHLFLFSLLLILVSCDSAKEPSETLAIEKEINKENLLSKDSLVGTWVSINPRGFQIVDIVDSTKGTVCRFEKWKLDSIQKRAFMKLDGKLTIAYRHNLSIQTKRFTFNYFLSHDTLFEMAEPGRVDTLLKVYKDSIVERLL